MPILTIRLSAELHERFLAECDKRDIKPSELGRKAIETIVDHFVDAGSPIMTQIARLPARKVVKGVRGFTWDNSGDTVGHETGSRFKTKREK